MKLLIYAQDRGGGNYISPVVKELLNTYKRSDLLILVHPLSQDIFSRKRIPYMSLEKAVGIPPVVETDWIQCLEHEKISHVFCTTSSPYLDMSNGNLIAASKRMDLPVMGVFDHWKGLDRFFQDGKPIFKPDYVCCIDEYCREKLHDIGFSNDDTFVVGHPYLETLIQQCDRHKRTTKTVRVLFVSQPDTAHRSFKGIFFARKGKDRLIDVITALILNIFSKQKIEVEIRYRPHPKEKLIEQLPEKVTMDKDGEWENALYGNDIFLGFDSMALIEACLVGKYAISFALPEFEAVSDNAVPVSFSATVQDLLDLSSIIEDAMDATTAIRKSKKETPRVFEGSANRTLSLIDKFVQGH